MTTSSGCAELRRLQFSETVRRANAERIRLFYPDSGASLYDFNKVCLQKVLECYFILVTIKIRKIFKQQSVKKRTLLKIKRTHRDRNFWVDKEDMSEGDRTCCSPAHRRLSNRNNCPIPEWLGGWGGGGFNRVCRHFLVRTATTDILQAVTRPACRKVRLFEQNL